MSDACCRQFAASTAHHLPVCNTLSARSSSLDVLLSVSATMHLVLGLLKVYLQPCHSGHDNFMLAVRSMSAVVVTL